jgi:hypothetical protein
MATTLTTNAVVAGAAQGILTNRGNVSATAADYNVVSNAAAAIAAEVVALGVVDVGVKEANLLQALTAAECSNRGTISAVAADYATVGGAIKAAYTSAVTKLV